MKLSQWLVLSLITLSALVLETKADVTLLVLGDIGEFQEFKDYAGNTDSDASVFKLDETAKTCTKLSGTWKGFEPFQTMLTKDVIGQYKHSCNADTVVILGDLIYPEVKSATVNQKKILKTEARYAGWRARVVCASYVLSDVLKSINCATNTKNPFGAKTSAGLYSKLNIISGNHSFDVDFTVEAAQVLALTAYNGYAFNTDTPPKDLQAAQTLVTANDYQFFPVMQTTIIDGVRIEFLDWNALALYCYMYDNPGHTEAKFNSCYYVSLYGIYFTYAQAQTYASRLVTAIRSFTPGANWRVMRSHHPPMNIQGYPDDQAWFWTVPFDSTGKTLMDLLKENNVNLLLTSHHHSSQVIIFPWSQLDLMKTTYKPFTASTTIGLDKVVSLDGSTCPGTSGNPTCPANIPNCYFNDIFLNQKTNTYTCDTTQKSMNFKHNASQPSNLIIIVQGGSGRQLDILQTDQKIPGAMLWARAVSHGGTQLTFKAKTFEAVYFEGETNYLQFNTVDSTSDTYPVIDNYVQQKLGGTLVDKVNNVQVAFNYTKYVDNSSSSSLSAVLYFFGIMFALLF